MKTLAGLCGVAALLLVLSGCEKLKARDNLGKGVRAFKNAQYPQAVDYFKTAVELDPTFPTARLYLATAYMNQWIPGAESPENEQMARAAMDQFHKVLEQKPNDEVATASIASIYFNQKKWDEAEQWYKKVIAVKPDNAQAYYTLGVIAWSRWYPAWQTARNRLGMKPEEPGPIKDKKVKEELKSQYLQLLNNGIQNLQKALQIDKEYDDAMAYINLLIRERADLDDTPEQYRRDIEIADNWVQKALATKKIKAERKPTSTGITTEK